MYKRIREMREDHDYLQKEIAEILHCTQVAYSRYELGQRDIPIEILIQLAQFYHTSTDYLLGLTDQIRPYPSGRGLLQKHGYSLKNVKNEAEQACPKRSSKR